LPAAGGKRAVDAILVEFLFHRCLERRIPIFAGRVNCSLRFPESRVASGPR
jgi:hypothetical protein